MKKCPYCGEPIQDSAKKCRYCGEWLETFQIELDIDHAQLNPVTDPKPTSELELTSSSPTRKEVDTIGSFMNLKFGISWLLALVLCIFIMLSLPDLGFFPFPLVCIGDFVVVALELFFLYKTYDWLKKQNAERSVVNSLSGFMITYAITHVARWTEDLYVNAVGALALIMAVVYIVIVIFKIRKSYCGTLLNFFLYALIIVAADVVCELLLELVIGHPDGTGALLCDVWAYGLPSLMAIMGGAKLFGNKHYNNNLLD